MEKLLEFLPGLVVIYFIIKKVIKGYNDIDVEDVSSKQDDNDEISMENVKQKINNNTPDYDQMSASDFNQEQPDSQLEKTESTETKDDDRTNDKSNNKSEKKSSQQNSGQIFNNKIKENDLVKGFVFKEILDKPRAKRPYRPPKHK